MSLCIFLHGIFFFNHKEKYLIFRCFFWVSGFFSPTLFSLSTWYTKIVFVLKWKQMKSFFKSTCGTTPKTVYDYSGNTLLHMDLPHEICFLVSGFFVFVFLKLSTSLLSCRDCSFSLSSKLIFFFFFCNTLTGFKEEMRGRKVFGLGNWGSDAFSAFNNTKKE